MPPAAAAGFRTRTVVASFAGSERSMPPLDPDAAETAVAFCDGAAKGNPGPGGWGAIVRRPDGRVTELGGAETPTTNNRMELAAAIAVLDELAGEPGPLVLYSDSTYVLRGITEWIRNWKRRGWKTATGGDVANVDQWQRLEELAGRRQGLVWKHVRGHAGIPGNERADTIASELALGREVLLFRGDAADYDVDLDAVAAASSSTAPRSKPSSGKSGSKSSAKAFSYLSYVDGKLERHRTWAECERRVRGRSGARYRKAVSAADEKSIVEGWGLRATALPS
jgi:ribonuclease HI